VAALAFAEGELTVSTSRTRGKTPRQLFKISPMRSRRTTCKQAGFGQDESASTNRAKHRAVVVPLRKPGGEHGNDIRILHGILQLANLMTVLSSTERLQPPIPVIGLPVKGCDSLLRFVAKVSSRGGYSHCARSLVARARMRFQNCVIESSNPRAVASNN